MGNGRGAYFKGGTKLIFQVSRGDNLEEGAYFKESGYSIIYGMQLITPFFTFFQWISNVYKYARYKVYN